MKFIIPIVSIFNWTLLLYIFPKPVRAQYETNHLSITTELFVNNYATIQLPQLHTLKIDKKLLKSKTIELIASTFQEFNLHLTEINNRIHDVCYNFVNDIIKSETDIVNHISKQKYELQKQNWNIVNKYTNPYYGITTTLPVYKTIIEINNKGNPLDEQDYFTIYKNKIIEVEQKIMNTVRMKQGLIQLCGTTFPAPVFQIDIKTGIFFSTANEFTVNIHFQDPESISILSAIIGKQISIMKLLLEEKSDLTETERLAYRSLQERLEIFLDMLTMSSIFIIHQHDDLDSTSKLEFILHKFKYAIHNYKSNINTLQKDLFPIQTKKLEEAIQLIIANSMHQFKQDTMIFTNYLHYFKQVVTSS